jgi:hypothetical protein
VTIEYQEIMEDMKQNKSRRVRGVLTIREGDDMEFRAERKTGVSAQQEIAKTAAGKLYRTVGEKKQSVVAHIVVPDGETDPTAFLYETVERLTRGMQTKARPKMRGKTLMDDDNARITLSKKEHKVEMVLTIDLAATPNYNQALMNLMYKVSQCFAINGTSLASARQ